MKKTREERRRMRQQLRSGLTFGALLLFPFWFPGVVELILH